MAARLHSGIYGTVRAPIFNPVEGFVRDDPPGYTTSVDTAKWMRKGAPSLHPRTIWKMEQRGFTGFDTRCFFTGITCDWTRLPDGQPYDALTHPFRGTRDHLVPVRRDIVGMTQSPPMIGETVWTSFAVNVTLRNTPLLVRLKVREWIRETNFDRSDTSVSMGAEIRWLLIRLLDRFRIADGRYGWSKKLGTNEYWIPEVQQPFMDEMYAAEAAFIAMKPYERNEFIRTFSWEWR